MDKEENTMKDEFDIMFSREESDIEKIANNYPAAGQREKEKIYEICKRKYNILKSEDKESESDGFIKQAEGVEVYKRPKLYRFLSVAAAVAIVAGGVGGYAFMKNRNWNNFGAGTTNPVQIEPGVPQELIDELNAVTDEMLSKLERYEAFHYGVGVDIEDCFSGSVALTGDPALDAEKIELRYCRVTDEELNSIEKMEAFSKSFLTADLRSNDFVSVKDDGNDEENISLIYPDTFLENHTCFDFVSYNDSLYSRDKSFEEHSVNLTEFSRYELVSSEFYDENDAGERTSLLGYGSDVIKCERIYKMSDDRFVTIVLDIVKEDDENGAVWKINKWDIIEKDSEGEVLTRKKSKNSFNPENIENVTNADAEGEFAELQLHEMKIYHSKDEAEQAFVEYQDAWKNHTYEFKKVDVEKYADQLLSAANAEELNTLENKSYLYHICANVFHYYDTAEVKFVIDGEQQALNYHEEYERVLDNKQLYFYNKITSRSDNENEKVSVYVRDGNEGVDYYPTDKTYSKQTYSEDDIKMAGAYIPDNFRVAYCDDYEKAGVQEAWEFGNTFGEFSNLDSFVLLSDFDQWHIEGVENILGRDCAHVNLVYNDGFNENTVDRWIDIRTGLVLKSSTKSDVLSQTTEVTELKLNEPVEKVDYDLTGYTFVENERGGF
ncbi:hypothetical protein SAMN02910265_00161 [Ruminococcus flavefaciens]|uniref:Uncharacterized protein n=2 Tax=Ruminococcus flavefaciens TaxID=1265 RepID=A0A1H6HQI9_RUMFL|nr:hypothetical protein SAMN02910265_00161 [Ruminococcus flavefaciens]